jgi:hypothetical protein
VAWGEEEIAAADSPRTVPYDEMPTEIHDFTATDPDFLRMSDAEIDRAIEEIKIALKKNKPTP